MCLEQAPICLVFEFMEHGCLSDYLRNQRGLFAAETLLGMCLDVCEGMAYLEKACVIHRDLVRAHDLLWEEEGTWPLKRRITGAENALGKSKPHTASLPFLSCFFPCPLQEVLAGECSVSTHISALTSPFLQLTL